jgi:hypothetical protein
MMKNKNRIFQIEIERERDRVKIKKKKFFLSPKNEKVIKQKRPNFALGLKKCGI